jgi:PAS domain S-box-containing protein
MSWLTTPSILHWIIAAATSIMLAFVAWRRRPARAARTFAVLMLCLAWWSLAEVLGAASVSLSAKVLWRKAAYLSPVTIPVAWNAFVLRYTQQRRLTRREIALLAVEPFITLVLVWTNEAHGWIWSRSWLDTSGSFSALRLSYGPWFWVNAIYSNFLGGLGAFRLIRASSGALRVYRRQAAAVLIGALILWIATLTYIAWPALGPGTLVLSVLLSGAVLAWNLMRLELFDLVPAARDAVMEHMNDGVFVLDAAGNIVDLNAAAQGFVAREPSELIGQPLARVFSAYPQLSQGFLEQPEGHREFDWGEGRDQRHLAVRISSVRGDDGQLVGRLLVLHDVTERKHTVEALQESEGKYRNVVERANDGIIIIQDGLIRYANPRTAEIVGYSTAQLVDTPFTAYLEAGNVAELADRYRRRMAGERVPRVYETSIVHRDGSKLAVEINAGLVTYEGQTADLIVLRDITERKRIEQELAEKARELGRANAFVTALSRVASRLESTRDPQQVLQSLGAELIQLGLRCAISMLDADGQTAVVQYVALDPAALAVAENLLGSEVRGYPLPRELWPDDVVVGQQKALFEPRAASIVSRLVPSAAASTLEEASGLFGMSGDVPAISLPLITGERTMGVLGVWGADLREDDIAPLSVFAGQVAAALENSRLFAAERQRAEQLKQELAERQRAEHSLRHRAEELAALQSTVLDITAARDLPNLLHTIVERAAQLLEAPSGGLYLCDPTKQEVRCVVSYNTREDYTGIVLKYGEGAAGAVAETGEPLVIDDYRSWSRRAPAFEEAKPFTAVLSAPMLWQGKVTGVIHVLDSAEDRRFTLADLELLSLFASHAAIAVENARLYSAAQRELTERKRLQEFSEGIVQGMAEGLVIEDEKGTITFVNPTLGKLLGYGTGELTGCPWQQIVVEREIERVQAKTAQRPNGISDRYETWLLSKEGREIPVLIGARPLFEEGTFIGVLSAVTDITERKRLEAQIEERRLYLERVLAAAPDAIITLDSQHLVQEWNQGAERLFGYSMEEARGCDLDHLITGSDPSTFEQAVAFTRQVLARQLVPPTEAVRYRKDGSSVHVVLAGSPILFGDELIGVVAVYADITERKRAEEQLHASLREKEVLLKEVHHRVKNNLQLISSLLYLQSLRAGEDSSAEMLQESLGRVESMALVHEKLYGSQDLARINFAAYVRSLTTSLVDSHGPHARDIDIKLDLDQVMLSVDLAIPCGMILNELLSNSLKYAFPGRRGGQIRVEFRGDGSGVYTLRVCDDGVGLPQAVDAGKAETLGLQLVKMLAEQLRGSVQVDSGAGTDFRITFPVPAETV